MVGLARALLAAFALLPARRHSSYVQRVAFDTVLYMLLALGLNVVVGWGGLLDLGYVAFYGIGAYSYALLGSEKLGVHLPTIVVIPLVVLIGAVAGFLVGLPSRRLVGDYLAIVTLFFLQLFLTVATNGDQIWATTSRAARTASSTSIRSRSSARRSPSSTRAPSPSATSTSGSRSSRSSTPPCTSSTHSRTGRAWRSLREDPLAAEAMGMPVNLLKLMAFSFGAAVAALSGTLFAALNASMFPLTFSFPLLITVYTMVILGGQGNLPGVVVGAVIVSVLLELLRDAEDARILLYAFVVLAMVFAFGRTPRLAVVLGGTHPLRLLSPRRGGAIDGGWTSGATAAGCTPRSRTGSSSPSTSSTGSARSRTSASSASRSALTLVHGWTRLILLIPTLYLAAFVWENVLLAQPDATRYIVLGAILVVLMVLRPNGLFGERRVEII